MVVVVFNEKTTRLKIELRRSGADGRGRTDTVLPPRDFESRASAISPHRHLNKFNISYF